MKNKPELLINHLYRATFNKRTLDPKLREILRSARRFVLDDEMAGFLTELVFESFQGRILKYRSKGTKRIFSLLDNIRYFSRLPHRVTWVEYSEIVKWQRFKRIEQRVSIPLWSETTNIDAVIREHMTRQTRMGWLMQQHPTIETSFRVSVFAGNRLSCFSPSQFDMVWDTEKGTVAWPIDPASAGSDRLTTTKGWFRSGVGEVPTMFPKWSNGGRSYDLRYIWTFLSTINKIPLSGTADVKPSHGFIGQGSYRQFLDHTIIKLNVPQNSDTRMLALRVLGDIVRRRAHQVRGHFRDDWHLPKGNKALWVAEHQRGDASLGFVVHDYDVHHD